ncbi:hypothetical protein GTW40_23380, partial [Streptomyces sp. SID4985]|uniref:ALF repeat-containing protein n=1 Tax=Streptomyces sp. SID4985 TaxID=2690292 RepID=UPI001380510A
AAQAAESLANRAASAARESRDAANAAATHAENAAKAAREAADHAGDAATAAQKATAHAAAAKEAADTATAAVTEAQNTYDLAREVEAEELAARTNDGIDKARDLKEQEERVHAEAAEVVKRGTDLRAKAQDLAARASAPDADTEQLVRDGRTMAVEAMKIRGSWSRAAAATALSGGPEDVLAYLRTGWTQAERLDTRAEVEELWINSPSSKLRTAAGQALSSDTATDAFLSEGQFEAVEGELRVYVAQLIDAGGPVVKERGRAALTAGTVDALRDFVVSGRDEARSEDERVHAAQLVDSGGPEVKAAARIALEGPASLLHAFTQTGEPMARQKDQLAATHVSQVQGVIAGAAQIAATAQQNASLAAKAAAEARNSAAEAQKAADDANASAELANGYAEDAKRSADAAATSAAQARDSANTARKAQADAENAVVRAVNSAAHAQRSANAASTSASEASASAEAARASAVAAGKDSAAATKAFVDAFATAVQKKKDETARWEQIKKQYLADHPIEEPDDGNDWIPDWLEDTGSKVLDYGEAIFTSPDLWIGAAETGGSIFLMGFGASEDLAGGAVCLTGIGCLAGAPAIAMGTGLVVTGAYGAADGVSRMSDGLSTALRNAGNSTGRTSAGGSNEQRAMDLVKEYPEYGNELPTVMKDPRWPASDGWVKMEQTVDDVEIHYVWNKQTRQAEDFKYKDRSQ